jgi:hypothetical protein
MTYQLLVLLTLFIDAYRYFRQVESSSRVVGLLVRPDEQTVFIPHRRVHLSVCSQDRDLEALEGANLHFGRDLLVLRRSLTSRVFGPLKVCVAGLLDVPNAAPHSLVVP